TDPAQLPALVAESRRASLLALATRASALDPMRAELVGLSLAVAPGRSWYLPFAHVASDGELAGGVPPPNLPLLASPALAPVRELPADPRVRKAGHGITSDWPVHRRARGGLAGDAVVRLLARAAPAPQR